MLSLILAAALAASPQPSRMYNFFDAADLLGHCAARDDKAGLRSPCASVMWPALSTSCCWNRAC